MCLNLQICQTCLSTDRKLFPLNSLHRVIQEINIEIANKSAGTCWECLAIMIRFCKFKKQVQLAQDTLAQYIKVENGKCLSKLTCTKVNVVEMSYFLLHNDPVTVSDDDQHMNIFKEEPSEDDNLFSRIVQQECEFKTIIDEGNGEIDTKDNEIILKNDEVTVKDNVNVEENKTGQDIAINDFVYNTNDSELLEVIDKMVITEEMMCKYREAARNNMDFQQSLYKCDSCITEFAEEKIMETHNKKYHNEKVGARICDICKQRFPSRKSLKEHIKRHYVIYKCKLCGLVDADLWCVWKHCKQQHQEHTSLYRRRGKNFQKSLTKLLDRDEEQSFHCLECGLQLADKRSLRNHTRKCYYKDGYTCEQCDKKFCYPQNYKRHLLIHSGMPVFKCEVCGKELRGAHGLKLHMKVHNNKVDEAAFCAECGVQYKSVHVYRAHLKRSARHVAGEDMRYKCAQCPRGFTSARGLLRHQRCRHTSGCDYVCHVCSHGCKTQETLRRHVRTKHEGERGPRDKVCHICGKGFRTKACLQQHVNSHLGRRPYECAACGDNFSYSGALYTHVKRKHRGNERPPHASTRAPSTRT